MGFNSAFKGLSKKHSTTRNEAKITVFTVSEIQLNIFDGGCHECCAVHTIVYCMQAFGGVGINIY
jgi:hypothetical protein